MQAAAQRGGHIVLRLDDQQLRGVRLRDQLGTKLLDHSFFVPMLVLSVTTVVVGAAIGAIFF